MPLGAWPRIALDAIRAKLDETKLRIERGGDPAGQRKLVADRLKAEAAEVTQQQEQADRDRRYAESQLTVRAMFDAWYPVASKYNAAEGTAGVRRMLELHLLPQTGNMRVSDITSDTIDKVIRTLIIAGKISTGVSLYMYIEALRFLHRFESMSPRPSPRSTTVVPAVRL